MFKFLLVATVSAIKITGPKTDYGVAEGVQEHRVTEAKWESRESLRTKVLKDQDDANHDKNFALPTAGWGQGHYPEPLSRMAQYQAAPVSKTSPFDPSEGPTNTCVNPVEIEHPPSVEGRVCGPPYTV